MQQQDLQQIKQTLKEELKKNNKKIFKKIDDKIDGLALITKKEFDQNTEQHNETKKELKKKPDKDEIFKWADDKIIPLQLDMDKAKYLHRHEWKKLPPAYEIRKTLVENGLA